MSTKNVFYSLFPVTVGDLYFKIFETSLITDEYLQDLNQSEYLKYSSLSKNKQNESSILEYSKGLSEINDIFLFAYDMSNIHIGNSTLRYNPGLDSIDISLRVNYRFRNRGLGKKMISLLIAHLSQKFLGVSFTAGTNKENKFMEKILLSNGFKLIDSTYKNEKNLYFILNK